MAKTILDEIFSELKTVGIVSSETEFSMDWLGRSECYMRTLRFERKEPSIATIAICASKLQHYGERMLESNTYRKVGKKFLRLSAQCHSEINKAAESKWLEQI